MLHKHCEPFVFGRAAAWDSVLIKSFISGARQGSNKSAVGAEGTHNTLTSSSINLWQHANKQSKCWDLPNPPNTRWQYKFFCVIWRRKRWEERPCRTRLTSLCIFVVLFSEVAGWQTRFAIDATRVVPANRQRWEIDQAQMLLHFSRLIGYL